MNRSSASRVLLAVALAAFVAGTVRAAEVPRAGGQARAAAIISGVPAAATVAKGASPATGLAGNRASDRQSFVEQTAAVVRSVNDAVLADRTAMWALRMAVASGAPLPPEQRLQLAVLTDIYGSPRDDLAELGRRVDVVPPSIVVAAAAVATDWGHRTALRDWAAMTIPAGGSPTAGRRPAITEAAVSVSGETYWTAAIRAYVRMLNAHPAYERFRRERERARLASKPLDGRVLAESLPRSAVNDRLVALIAAEGLEYLDRLPARPAGSGP